MAQDGKDHQVSIKVSARTLNDLMSFDHVIQVHADGSVTEPRGVWAPELHDGQLFQGGTAGEGWELMNGYSGQYMYSGPTMHESEFIGGRMARDILATPGLYVAIEDIPSDDSEPTGWAVAHKPADALRCECDPCASCRQRLSSCCRQCAFCESLERDGA